ncbi:MAG: hypothetical protein IBX47_01965 [Desulfuromonadales bacterium]|nr:hypothetical protein [Desulfuromonadales bacterium]
MNRSATLTVIGVILVLVALNYWSRFARHTRGPAPSVITTGVWVQFGEGFPEKEVVRQFCDKCSVKNVIELTEYTVSAATLEKTALDAPIESGRRIDLLVQESEIKAIYFLWMTASQRVVLDIPLHPDRMTLTDWEFLPGVGAKTAAIIDGNRQKFGEFGSLEGLRRIKGVGSSKIEAWRNFF